MIRRLILRHPRLTPLLVILAVTTPIHPASAQDRAVQERLDRLEKDLSMLQRQVYRGAGPPQVIPSGSAAVDAELRMDRLETQMRELTGRVEDAMNAVEQLRSRLEQVNSDLDVRLSQGPPSAKGPPTNSHALAGIADASPAASVAMRGPPLGTNTARPRSPSDPMPPGTLIQPPPDPPPGPATLFPPGQFPQRADAAPIETGSAPFRPPSGASLPAGSPSEQYNAAFGLLKQADYPGAEGALKTFIQRYPNDPLTGSAQYWLGETYYARGRYSEAASAFAEGYKNYPKGAKAPDDLLKLGMSLARANQKQNACVAFAQLDHDFPHAATVVKERATEEKKRLGC
jgi:tol-pal system protein YbgF